MLFIVAETEENRWAQQEVTKYINLSNVTSVSYIPNSLLTLTTADGENHILEGELREKALETIQKHT